MNYAAALQDFSQIFNDSQIEPQCILSRSAPYLDIYRNNTIANRNANLANTYLTLVELVGADFFAAMAGVYIQASPSGSGNLHEDGADFAAFLNDFTHTADLPWLSDMARLDWAIHQAHYSPDCAALSIDSLVALPPEQFGQLKLQLHPAVAVIRSAQWPVYQILMMHHGDAPADLNAGGEQVLVWRNHWQALPLSEAVFIEHILNGQSIEKAIEATEQEFDAGRILIRLFSLGLVCQINA